MGSGSLKIGLRREALRAHPAPVVLETHGGMGKIGDVLYGEVATGVAFDLDPAKAGILAAKRPHWRVYQGDCVAALAAGIAADLKFTFLDCDPYGDPWPSLDAFFGSDRAFASRMHLVVNDGLRAEVRISAWRCHSMAGMVARYGNDLGPHYLEVCRILLKEKAARAGYALDGFRGFYAGYNQQMTHYTASLTREGGAPLAP